MLSFHSYWTYSKASHIWSKLTAPILHAVILGQGGAIWNFNKNRKTKKGAVGVFRIWALIRIVISCLNFTFASGNVDQI